MAHQPVYKPFLFTYQFDEKPWGFQLPATSYREAERRVRAIGLTGRVDGELVASIPPETVPRVLRHPAFTFAAYVAIALGAFGVGFLAASDTTQMDRAAACAYQRSTCGASR